MTHRSPDDSQVPDLLLERYRLGEMSPAEIEEMRHRLALDEDLRTRLRALDESDDEIRRRYPSGWLAERIRGRLDAGGVHPTPVPRLPRFGWRIPLAAAAAVVVIALGWRLIGPNYLQSGWQAPDSIESGDRLKGGLLAIFRKTEAGSEMLADGASAQAGDQIRIGYRAAGSSYGVILSIDGRGILTLHYPLQGRLAAPLNSDGLTLLDYGYELDDAPGWERFYLVTGNEAFDIEPVLDSAGKLAEVAKADLPGVLQLPSSFTQWTFTLRKEKSQ